MSYYNSHNAYYSDNHEPEDAKIQKAAGLNEISHVNCSSCQKKIVRIFNSKPGLKPVFKDNIVDYLRHMRKAMGAYDKRSKNNGNFISGPNYIVIFNGAHFKEAYSDNISKSHKASTCSNGIFIGEDPIELATRMFLRFSYNRTTCIANGIKPQDVKDWLSTISINDINDIIYQGFQLKQIDKTNLWGAIYHNYDINAVNLSQKQLSVGGDIWAKECDPILADIPIRSGSLMRDMHGNIVYESRSMKSPLAIDLPGHMPFSGLIEYNWNQIVNIELSDGTKFKTLVAYDGTSAEYINRVNRSRKRIGMPREFWVIQPTNFVGSTEITSEDIVL